MLMYLVIASIDDRLEGTLAEVWHPPMTADGREMRAALEIEKVVRELCGDFLPKKPPPFRPPGPHDDPIEHTRLQNARVATYAELRQPLLGALLMIEESDAAFTVFPKEAHERLRRIRTLLSEIGSEGMPYEVWDAP